MVVTQDVARPGYQSVLFEGQTSDREVESLPRDATKGMPMFLFELPPDFDLKALNGVSFHVSRLLGEQTDGRIVVSKFESDGRTFVCKCKKHGESDRLRFLSKNESNLQSAVASGEISWWVVKVQEQLAVPSARLDIERSIGAAAARTRTEVLHAQLAAMKGSFSPPGSVMQGKCVEREASVGKTEKLEEPSSKIRIDRPSSSKKGTKRKSEDVGKVNRKKLK